MKRAFTLIEMIAVILIIAIISVFAFPPILKQINSTKGELSESMTKIIYSAGELYASDKRLPKSEENRYCVTLRTLVDLEYLNSNLVDPVTHDEIGLDKYVSISVFNNNYKYEIVDECVSNPPDIQAIAKSLVYENGVCKTDGTTYNYMDGCYVKGSTATTIWFSGFLYYIMGINADGSVRLITVDSLTSIPWGPANSATDYEHSYMRKWLNEVNSDSELDGIYYNSINDTSVIVDGSFCLNSIDATSGGPSRITCTGTIFNDKVGLVSIDEYNLSGGIDSYLDEGDGFYTMSPADIDRVWEVTWHGSRGDCHAQLWQSVASVELDVRPIINIAPTTIVTAGPTTSIGYYVLNEEKENVASKRIATVVTPGDYVTFAGKNYRVVSIDTYGNTKMILNDMYPAAPSLPYGTNGTTVPNCTLCTSSVLLDWLVVGDANYASKLARTTWYQGLLTPNGSDYEFTSLNQDSVKYENSYMGLIRMGELFSGGDAWNLYWLATPMDNYRVWHVGQNADADIYESVTSSDIPIRPAVTVSNTTIIMSGNGTSTNPYQI